MASLIYLDNSNFYISALKHLQETMGQSFRPHSLRYDRLLDLLSLGEPAKKATIYASENATGGTFDWGYAKRQGWQVEVRPRSFFGHEKMIDSEIVSDMILDGLELVDPEQDQIILVAGDSDYLPVVRKLHARNIPVYVAFWDFYIHHSLRDEAALFFDLSSQMGDLLVPARNAA